MIKIIHNYYIRKFAIKFLSFFYFRNNFIYRYLFQSQIKRKLRGAIRIPPILLIENTNLCNAHCIICSRDLMTREIGFMNFNLFKKIIDEGIELGCTSIKITGFGEPFMDKEIFEKIKYAKARKISYVCVFTNGSLLHDSLLVKIIDSGLDEIFFSIDTGIKEDFERIRKNLSFDKVDAAVEKMQQIKKEKHMVKPIVSINAVETGENSQDIKSLYKRYQKVVDRISVQLANNWTSQDKDITVFKDSGDFYQYPCPYPYFYLMIRHNGDVSICCFDFNSKTTLGNAEFESLKNIWQGPAMTEIRQLLQQGRRRQIKACQYCLYYPNWWANFD